MSEPQWIPNIVDVYGDVRYDLGYEPIPIIRPSFVYFKFEGLRPSTPHWLFFDNKDVTKWVNLSYNFTDYNALDRTSPILMTGDQYKNATQFPNQLGGPTAASGPVTSDANGTLEGLFYLQSSSLTSYNTGIKLMTATDISVLDRDRCRSWAQTEYYAAGEEKIWFERNEVVGTEDKGHWYYPPDPPPPATSSPANDNSSNSSTTAYKDAKGNWNYVHTDKQGDSYTVTAGVGVTSVTNNGYTYKPTTYNSSGRVSGTSRVTTADLVSGAHYS